MYRTTLLFILPCTALAALSLVACASVVRKDAPTIAHIHIGHAITSWPETPKNQGLLVVAELKSVVAATNAELLLDAARNRNIDAAKRYLREVAMAVDPQSFEEGHESDYGLRRSAAEAMTHLRLAADVFDASANVQRTVAQSNVRAQQILDRCDELIAMLQVGLESTNIDDIEIIAEEVALKVRAIAGGPQTQGLYGLYELRQDVEAMVARENPPYKTVDQWYLFNLVKLPDGQWGFSSRNSRGAAGAGY